MNPDRHLDLVTPDRHLDPIASGRDCRLPAGTFDWKPRPEHRGASKAPPARVERASVITPLREATRSFERMYVLAALRRHGGRIPPAAEELGLRPTNLYRKLRQLGVRFHKGMVSAAGEQV